MAISFSQISDYMLAATAALVSGDYATARDNAIAAQALASILPDTNRSSGMGGSQGLIWDRIAISQFVDRVQRLLNSSGGVLVSKVEIVRPTQIDGTLQVGSTQW